MGDEAILGERFDALIFDWDGTAVPDREADATEVRALLEQLSGWGVHVAVVSGTHLGNVDGQLQARPKGPGRLWLALNRGSELFLVGANGPQQVDVRVASAAEEAALDRAAAAIVADLATRGLTAAIVSKRLNRRKIDLIPLPEWDDPPKAAIDRLVVAVNERLRAAGIDGLPEVVAIAQRLAADCGLPGARITSDAKHVEVGLTDKRDASRAVFEALWNLGIAPADCLVGGDEFGALGGVPGSDSLMLVPEAAGATAISVGVEPEGVPPAVRHLAGGPATFVAVLREQIEMRERRVVPEVRRNDGWVLEFVGADARPERAREALLTISDGVVATSGAIPTASPGATPALVYAGVFRGHGPETELAPGPLWDRVDAQVVPDGDVTRRLDLHTGVLGTVVHGKRGDIRSVRFMALDRPGTGVLRITADEHDSVPPEALVAPENVRVREGGRNGSSWMIAGDDGESIAAAGMNADGDTTFDRFAVYDRVEQVDGLLDRLDVVAANGFDRLLVSHRAAWASRWGTADITIRGDEDLQLAVRLSLFHVMQSAGEQGEAPVGARGLTGPAYRGHVFWDADAFALPVLAATVPSAARAMLRYRTHRLDAARAAARAEGRRGARFPWESAAAGDDVTPRTGTTLDGEIVPILTGPAEVHIVADVALAAATYIDWTGDAAFARGAGRKIFIETARYWATRMWTDEHGAGHISGVIGPDEYHELVDDNAFTNVMARWNLRRALRSAGDSVSPEEKRHWSQIAESLVDGYDPMTGLYEQFAGFFGLEDLRIADIAPYRPITADALLGRDRVAGAQVVKQADVLMLHHLVPDEVEAGSLAANLAYYEPRCAHGSSLSPGVHASLMARAGRIDDALHWLRVATRLDLDDVTGATAGGVHLAAMATVWHALVRGFGGVRPQGDALVIEPILPPQWDAYEIRVRFRGVPVRVVVGDSVVVHAPTPVKVRRGRQEFNCGPGSGDLGAPRRAERVPERNS